MGKVGDLRLLVATAMVGVGFRCIVYRFCGMEQVLHSNL